MPPIIGITCKTEAAITDYTDAIVEFGGDPLPFVSLTDPIPQVLREIDGLLLPGGGDLDPRHYNEPRYHVNGISKIKGVSQSRDALELDLCQKALAADIPVFGICRGIQVMSVATGGSLYQDIHTQLKNCLLHKDEESIYDARHSIKIQPNSRLSGLTDSYITEVNSAHHQALKVIGAGFVVTAQSEDGIIEAIESPSHRFAIGVQYHPERMLQRPELRGHGHKLFEAFIHAASQSGRTR